MTHSIPAVSPSGQGQLLSPAPRPGNFIHDRWHVLQLVKDTARLLGIGEREVSVLGAHLSVLPKGPIRSDQLLISFAQVAGILERANCMDERRFRRGEARLAEVGLIDRKLSGNARRFPIRDGRGQIVDAYGIDLRALFLRVPELEAMRDRLNQEAAERRAIKSRISAAVSNLKRQAMFDDQPLPEDLEIKLQDIQRLCRRSRITIVELLSTEKALHEIIEQQSSPDTTDTLPDNLPGDGGQIDRPIESKRKDYTIRQPVLKISTLWKEHPRLAAYFPDTPDDARQLSDCLLKAMKYLGFSEKRASEVLRHISLKKLLALIENLLGRLAEIENPQAYLLAMIENRTAYEAQDKNLCVL